MTTEKDTDVTPGYGQPVNNCPKRYELGSRRYNNEVVPCMIEHPEGKYVLFDEYEAMLKINHLQDLLMRKLRDEKQSPQGPSSRLFGGRS